MLRLEAAHYEALPLDSLGFCGHMYIYISFQHDVAESSMIYMYMYIRIIAEFSPLRLLGKVLLEAKALDLLAAREAAN